MDEMKWKGEGEADRAGWRPRAWPLACDAHLSAPVALFCPVSLPTNLCLPAPLTSPSLL